jgi:hypothetical protein
MNEVMKFVDEPQYEALKKLREEATKRLPYLAGLQASDPLFMEGRAIMFNRQTPVHPDRQDPFKAWATMITLGKFSQGGSLYIPRLKLRIRYLPGDVVAIRGRILPHEVEAWGDGQRVSIAHFTHESLWRLFGMSCP